MNRFLCLTSVLVFSLSAWAESSDELRVLCREQRDRIAQQIVEADYVPVAKQLDAAIESLRPETKEFLANYILALRNKPSSLSVEAVDPARKSVEDFIKAQAYAQKLKAAYDLTETLGKQWDNAESYQELNSKVPRELYLQAGMTNAGGAGGGRADPNLSVRIKKVYEDYLLLNLAKRRLQYEISPYVIKYKTKKLVFAEFPQCQDQNPRNYTSDYGVSNDEWYRHEYSSVKSRVAEILKVGNED